MKKLFSCLMLACGCSLALATDRTPPTHRDRDAAIWNIVDKRLNHQADVFFDEGDYAASTNILRLMASADPASYWANNDLGWMLENMGQYDEALAVYIRFRKRNPNDADAAFPEANFYFLHKAWAKVPPVLEPTLTKHPDPNSYRLLAHAYRHLGMFLDSERVWKLYLARFPDDATARRNMAEVQKKIRGQEGSGK